MNKVTEGNLARITFNSIHEVVEYINNTERTLFYSGYHISDEVGSTNAIFTGTSDFNEALDLLHHGWDRGAKKLNRGLTGVCLNNGISNKRINVYDVVGYQACAPRYLQGIPTNMVRSINKPMKQKVVDVVKDFGYSGIVSAETMTRESIKVLNVVNKLEQEGHRCNVYTSFISRSGWSGGGNNTYTEIRVKIKQSTQRMNVKQMAFPLAHPSMFRRICFALIERLPETSKFGKGYGWCTDYDETKQFYKGTYYIPRIVSEQEITDINKYRAV